NNESTLLHNIRLNHTKYLKHKKQIQNDLTQTVKKLRNLAKEAPIENRLEILFTEIVNLYKKYNLYSKLNSSPCTFPVDHKIQKLTKKKNSILKIRTKLLSFYNRIYKQLAIST